MIAFFPQGLLFGFSGVSPPFDLQAIDSVVPATTLDAPEGKLIVNPCGLEECNSTLSDFFLAIFFLPGSPLAIFFLPGSPSASVLLVVDATAELVGLDFDRDPSLVVDATADLVG